MTVPEEHRAFADEVASSRLQDPYATLGRLAEVTGVAVDDLVHHALVRYVSAGSEALLSLEPLFLRQLIEARRLEDWQVVAGMIDWLEAGL